MGRVSKAARATKHFKSVSSSAYSAFEQLDGEHDWQQAVPDGCVLYPVRRLNQGKVIYFNFDLAVEMGLLSSDHPKEMNSELEKVLLNSFSLRIINEYDQSKNIRYHPTVLKSNKYMATRYLQLQHRDKRGSTSGDGRAIWNGTVSHKGKIWDVSSRGTGVTRLSPGAAEAGKPLKSGSSAYGYGCGTADIDELLGSAIMAEIFHKNGVNTERVLTVIDFEDGNGIGVRAAKNLFRPAHLFNFLKQGNLHSLRSATKYIIDRQFSNGDWDFNSKSRRPYNKMLSEITKSFAQFAAQLEREYIFAWLDWDGDNMLLNGGIIDYGSIRQFGLRHDEYRYDDIDRFSTNLNEQRIKAKQLVQTFAQLCDFLENGRKRKLSSFAKDVSLKSFDDYFDFYLKDYFLYQLGLSANQRSALLKKNKNLVNILFNNYMHLEKTKTCKGRKKVPDGINRPPIFNMRTILHDLPIYFSEQKKLNNTSIMPESQFFLSILAKSAKGKDRRMKMGHARLIRKFQKSYLKLMKTLVEPDKPHKSFFDLLAKNNSSLCCSTRLTGDGLLYVVDELLRQKRNDYVNLPHFQKLIDDFIQSQCRSKAFKPMANDRHKTSKKVESIFKSMLSLIDGNRESI